MLDYCVSWLSFPGTLILSRSLMLEWKYDMLQNDIFDGSTRRWWKKEGLFGEAKENHCLRRARYRGIQKVQIQFYMIAIAQNFKRLLSLIFNVVSGMFFLLRGDISWKRHFIYLKICKMFEDSKKFVNAA